MELRFLQQEHCDEMQGYLLGAPARIETFRGLTHNGDVAPRADKGKVPALARSA